VFAPGKSVDVKVERESRNQGVGGSNPSRPTFWWGMERPQKLNVLVYTGVYRIMTTEDEKTFRINVMGSFIGVILALAFGFTLQGLVFLLEKNNNAAALCIIGAAVFGVITIGVFFYYKNHVKKMK